MLSDIYWVTEALAISARPRGGEWLDDEVGGWRRGGVTDVVSLLTAEEVTELELDREPVLCRAAGLVFHEAPVPDRGLPPSALGFWRTAAALSEGIARGRRVLAHCRQGIGRSSLMAAATLVLAEDPDARDPEAVFQRIEAARGRPVPDTAEQRAWLVSQAGLNWDKVLDLR